MSNGGTRRDWTDKDEAEFEAWLGEAIAHRVTFLRLNSSWRRTERLVALRSPEHERILLAWIRQARRNYLKVAAEFGLFFGAGGFLAAYLHPHRALTLIPRRSAGGKF